MNLVAPSLNGSSLEIATKVPLKKGKDGMRAKDVKEGKDVKG